MQTTASLLATKLFIPASGRHVVRRLRLEERLKQGCAGALTVICAPAGFGKTTILTDWLHHHPQPVAWLSLDAQDNDPARFLSYWTAALQQVFPDIGRSTLEQLQSPQAIPFESLLVDMLNDITTSQSTFMMVFDDYHCITNPQIHQLLTFFLEHAPPTCHLCLTTRSDPPFPLARLRSRGLLTEIRARELAFTQEEISAFYQALGMKLSDTDTSLLRDRTEGWIAGLQLAGLSMQNVQNSSDFIRKFRGTHRYIVDYLVEEVLQSQSPEMQDFLLQTSVLDRLCGELCDTVTGQKTSQHLLEQLEASDFFIFALDEERHWFRYHHLLSDVLRQRLKHAHETLIPELHQKAAHWFAEQQFESEALQHAFAAEDYDFAAKILERMAERIWEGGSRFSLLHWFEQLPEEFLTSNLQLSLFAAKEQLYAGKMQEAEQMLLDLERSVQDRKHEENVPSFDNLTGRMMTMRIILAMYRGDIPTLLQYSEQALQLLPEEDNVWLAMVATMMGVAYYWDGPGHIRKAKELFAESLAMNKHENAYFHLLYHVQILMVEKTQGALNLAFEQYTALYRFAEEQRLAHSSLAGVILSELGDILMEQYQIERGMEYILQGLELSEKTDIPTMRWWAYNMLAKAYLYQGEYTRAQSAIDDTFAWLEQKQMASWYTSISQARQGQVFLLSGDLERAVQWAEEQNLRPDDELSHIRELQHIVYSRLLIARKEYKCALALLDRLLAMTESHTRFHAAIEVHLIKAMLFYRQKCPEDAAQEVVQALALAEPGGYITYFLQEGPSMAELIRNAVKLKHSRYAFSLEYAKRVLAAFPNLPTASHPELLDDLSERELDVLRCLAQGMSNQGIADTLYVSLNTVKTHLKRINSKLDVTNRTEAVARGRELGLI